MNESAARPSEPPCAPDPHVGASRALPTRHAPSRERTGATSPGPRPAIPGVFCSLCGSTDLAGLGGITGICLDKDECHRRQYVRLALNLLAADHEREDLRPADHDGKTRETKFAGRRLTVSPVAPWSAVAALTTHYRHTPELETQERDDEKEKEAGHG